MPVGTGEASSCLEARLDGVYEGFCHRLHSARALERETRDRYGASARGRHVGMAWLGKSMTQCDECARSEVLFAPNKVETA